MEQRPRSKNPSKDKMVKGTRVRISEVNAEDSVPIIPGKGNREFDDPVTPNKNFSDKKEANK